MRQLWRIAVMILCVASSAAIAQTAPNGGAQSAQSQVRDPAAGADPRGKPLGESTILRDQNTAASHGGAAENAQSPDEKSARAAATDHPPQHENEKPAAQR